MKSLTREQFASLLADARVSRRLTRDIRFVPESIDDWGNRDFIVATVKSGAEGVLVYQDRAYPFTLSAKPANASGRAEAIICDVCATWQRGSNAAVLTFRKSEQSTVSHLVCADLDCSLHVRNLTPAAKISRTQLREHIDTEGRIVRLRERLARILTEVM